jgi:hypothetical protein
LQNFRNFFEKSGSKVFKDRFSRSGNWFKLGLGMEAPGRVWEGVLQGDTELVREGKALLNNNFKGCHHFPIFSYRDKDQ